MSGSSRVVVIGSYNEDHSWQVERLPQLGETLPGSGHRTGPGGKGFNQAIACARLDVATAFIGARGADAAGTAAAQRAIAEGLDARWQVCDGVPTGSACVLLGPGDNAIVVALGANEALATSHVDAHAALFATAHGVLLQGETNREAVDRALDHAERHHLLRILNPAPAVAWIGHALLARCDVLTPNETEFTQLLERCTGTKLAPDAVAGLADDALDVLCRKLGAPHVIVTLGAAGCFVSQSPGTAIAVDAARSFRVPAESAHVVDTAGAGDCFNGALVAALARDTGTTLRDAVVYANRCAALKTERHGTVDGMPHYADVIGRFR